MTMILASNNGGDRGIRTPHLCDANAALSQLSYIPVPEKIIAYPFSLCVVVQILILDFRVIVLPLACQ